METIRKAAKKYGRENLSDDELIAFFSNVLPLTLPGLSHLDRAIYAAEILIQK